MTTIVRAAAGMVLTGALAAGCANTPATTLAPPTPSAALVSVSGQHAGDVAYAQMMMPHVVQGVTLTDLVPGRAANPALAQLVESMNYVDVEEQGQLAGQLHLWRAAVPGENGVPLGQMPGMADQATLARLSSLSGPAFDRAWLAVMIAHHQGGVDMSHDYLAHGGAALAGVAQAQVEIGTRQIGQMRSLQSPT